MKNPGKKRRKKRKSLKNIKTFFLACEFKPNGANSLWSVLEPFAYDIKPAFVYGSLGIIGYEPMAYSIIDMSNDSQPLLGYVCTISEPNTITLLDKVKGYNGENSFCTHSKKLIHAYTDVEEVTDAWAYVISDYVLETYEQIEQVEFGIWDQDEKQIHLLEKIGHDL